MKLVRLIHDCEQLEEQIEELLGKFEQHDRQYGENNPKQRAQKALQEAQDKAHEAYTEIRGLVPRCSYGND